jgi:hypothetical protein
VVFSPGLGAVLLIACGTSAPAPGPVDTAPPPDGTDAGDDASADTTHADVFAVEVRGGDSSPVLRTQVSTIVHDEVAAFLAHHPEATRPFVGRKFVVRLIAQGAKLSDAPEASDWPFSLAAFDGAYGATCVNEVMEGSTPVRVTLVRISKWTPITAIHEAVHAIHFTLRDANEGRFDAQVRDAAAHSTVSIDLSASAYEENLAYKAQYFLPGQGAFLAAANDPVAPLLEDWFGGPLFPDLSALAKTLYDASRAVDAGR